MKKIYLSLIAIAFAINLSYAQSIFPTDGSNVGIGTTSPTRILSLQHASTNTYMSFNNSGRKNGLWGTRAPQKTDS